MLSILNLLSGKKGTGKPADERSVAQEKAGAMLRAGSQEAEERDRLPSLGENETADLSKLDYKKATRQPGAKVGTSQYITCSIASRLQRPPLCMRPYTRAAQ